MLYNARHSGTMNSLNIKTLLVCSGNKNSVSPFILDQKKALEKKGIKTDLFTIKGKGMFGYLKNLSALISKIKSKSYNLVHAHFGLSGLLACLQNKVPVIITLHGSDVNDPKARFYTQPSIALAKKIIVVSEKMKSKLNGSNKIEVIPCGVDMELFHPMEKEKSRKKLESLKKMNFFHNKKKYILFSSSFDIDVKNAELAVESVKAMGNEYDLIELKGYSRKEVVLLMNAVDATLLTSRQEGSPQFIKEAMACNCPIVSTNVGDVHHIINQTNGCYVCNQLIDDVTEKLYKAVNHGKTNGRDKLPHEYKQPEVVNRIVNVYREVLDC